MANNTTLNTMSGGDVVSDDQLTTLNGGGIATGEKAQRMKLTWGVAGTGQDVTGPIGLPVQGISAATSTASWTSATTVNTALSINAAGMNAVSVTLVATTTFTGGVITFEASPDNTNWVPMAMARIDTFTVESTYTIVASTNRGWTSSVDGFNYFRVRLSTAITGTGTASIFIIPQAFSVEPLSTVGQATAANLNATVVQSGTWTVQPGNTANTTPWLTRHAAATTSSGLLNAKILAAATTNATSVKASAGAIYGYHLANTATTTRYFRVFNLATAPTMGTSSPIFVLPLPPSGGAVMQPNTMNFALSTGFAYAITAAAADLDATACAANDVVGTVWYI